MFCFGRHWEPREKAYSPIRALHDGAKPPVLPDKLSQLAKQAVSIAQQSELGAEIPGFDPDVCIVNFYEKEGKLGMHQDKDEARETLLLGLPVVSFSIGDPGVFSYGFSRNEVLGRVDLRSGDVVVFGGEARLVYHGVEGIKVGEGPGEYPGGVRMKQGRLNLTFR